MMADAETSLRALLRTVAAQRGFPEPHIDVKPITSGGANFTSALFLATISSPGLPDLRLFAKVACISEKIRARFNADALFNTEQIFYNKLIKLWDSFDEKYQVPEQHRLTFPKYYGGNPEKGSETVVLENLVAVGYGSYNRFKSVDWEHASKSVEVLAKFHAFSYIYSKEDSVEYEAMAKELKFDMKQDDDPSLKGLWDKMVSGSVALVDERYQDRVRDFLVTNDAKQLFEKYHRPIREPVLAHGDYRPSNLLFKKQGDEVHPIALDFQTVHAGSPVADLVYFIFIGSDEEFRKEHYHQLVEHYYLQLGLALGRYQLDIAEVYPREHFDDDLKQTLPYALILGVMVLPVVTVEAESAPKIDGDADLDSFVVPPNQLYAERFRGIVNDLARWGVI